MRTEAADGATRGASAGALKESGEAARESMLEPEEACGGQHIWRRTRGSHRRHTDGAVLKVGARSIS
jgi:hypothetical protein